MSNLPRIAHRAHDHPVLSFISMLHSLMSYDSGKLIGLTPEPQGCPTMGQLREARFWRT